MKNREFFIHFNWPISFIQILNGGDGPIQFKMFTHIPCGNSLFNFYANKLKTLMKWVVT